MNPQPDRWFCNRCGHPNQGNWNACQICRAPNPNMPPMPPPMAQKTSSSIFKALLIVGVVIIAGCAGLAFLGSLGRSVNKSNPTIADSFSSTTATPTATPVEPKKQALSQVSLDFKWGKEGFGNVMMADFTITNSSSFAIKDIEVTCTHYANSGTEIDSNVRTIYEVVPAKQKKTFRNFNMGFIHTQARKSNCRITDLEVN